MARRLMLFVLLTACNAGAPVLSLTARPSRIDDRGQSTVLTATAVDAYEKPGRGAVKFSSAFGTLAEPQTITLDSDGNAQVDFSCDALSDIGCHDRVRVVAEWATAGKTYGADLRLSVGPLATATLGTPCRDEARQVFVIDASAAFSIFDPVTRKLIDVGHLACSTTSTPFSMAISRDAFAYVLYQDGTLYKVSTRTLACEKTAFAGGSAFHNFGMGFSSVSAGSDEERLYIAGGNTFPAAGSTLADLDVPTFTHQALGTVAGWPELTGTGEARLWGFFPEATSGVDPFVAQLSKVDGASQVKWPLPTLAGQPTGWAFAYWGGRFWIFLERMNETSTSVYEVEEADGGLVSTTPLPAGRKIVGAGTSTCTPAK